MKLSVEEKGVRRNRSVSSTHWPVRGTGLDLQNEQTDYVMGQKLKTGKSRSKGACVILVLLKAFFQLFSVGHFLITMTNVWYEQLRDGLRRCGPSQQEGLMAGAPGCWAHSCQWSGSREIDYTQLVSSILHFDSAWDPIL